MEHDHHGHNHAPPILTNVSRAFVIGIVLNFAFVLVEVVVGLSIHSLSLLSDAGHNLADVASLGLSLFAFKMLKVKATETYTYGYRKSTILVALFNAVVLLVSIGAIGYEAAHRFLNPEPTPGNTIALVAGIGIVINTLTALMFFRDKKKDLNIKSAYLHLMSDAIVSLGLVIGGVVIHYTHLYWIDPVLSIVIALVIVFSTWNLLKHSLRLSMDGVPVEMNLQTIKEAATKIKGVKNIHHVHLWAMSTTENALTAHIVIAEKSSLADAEKIKAELKHELQHLNIQHVTLEVESTQEDCETDVCET